MEDFDSRSEFASSYEMARGSLLTSKEAARSSIRCEERHPHSRAVVSIR